MICREFHYWYFEFAVVSASNCLSMEYHIRYQTKKDQSHDSSQRKSWVCNLTQVGNSNLIFLCQVSVLVKRETTHQHSSLCMISQSNKVAVAPLPSPSLTAATVRGGNVPQPCQYIVGWVITLPECRTDITYRTCALWFRTDQSQGSDQSHGSDTWHIIFSSRTHT